MNTVVLKYLIDEAGEPDSELSEDRRSELIVVYEFLRTAQLEQYFELLTRAGYDDLKSLLEQMATPVPLNARMLSEVGINKPGHRRKLLLKLQCANTATVRHWSLCGALPLCRRSPGQLADSLETWLSELKLGELLERFVDSGYDSIQFLRELMDSSTPVNEQILLEEVGIEKPGHRFRIIAKLLDEQPAQQRSQATPRTCESCSLL